MVNSKLFILSFAISELEHESPEGLTRYLPPEASDNLLQVCPASQARLRLRSHDTSGYVPRTVATRQSPTPSARISHRLLTKPCNRVQPAYH